MRPGWLARAARALLFDKDEADDSSPREREALRVRLREELNLSGALFAVYLRTNLRTLENWEQGRARPNAQAVLLLRLVERFPDTVERLASV